MTDSFRFFDDWQTYCLDRFRQQDQRTGQVHRRPFLAGNADWEDFAFAPCARADQEDRFLPGRPPGGLIAVVTRC